MKPRFLITAQSFGFGPVSKGVTIVSILKSKYGNEAEFDFIGDDTALTFVKGNSELFNNIYESTKNKLINLIKSNNYVGLISVMEPYSVVLAKKYNMNVFSIDSLHWFWNWDNSFENLLKDLDNSLYNYSPEMIINTLDKIDPHNRQKVTHQFSDLSFLQKYPGKKSNQSKFQNRKFKKVNPIIDDSYKDKEIKRDKLLISLSGQLSPIVDVDMALEYGLFCLKLLKEPLQELDGIEPILVGNPKVMKKVKERTKFNCGLLSHKDMLKNINRAIGFLCPPSITSLYESLYYETPVFFLPEQHDGHYPNYERLMNSTSSQDGTFPKLLLSDYFEELKSTKESEVHYIYEKISELMKNTSHPVYQDLKRKSLLIKSLGNETFRKNLILKQRKKLKYFIKDKPGGYQIAKEIFPKIEVEL